MRKSNFRNLALALALATGALQLLGLSASAFAEEPSRSFLMGTTKWPPDMTLEAVQSVKDFQTKHTDLTAIHLDNGVPWEESLKGQPYPQALEDELRAKAPAGHKLLVAITPLNLERSALSPPYAKNWSPMSPWAWKAMDSEDVKQAYINYAKKVVDTTHPDYLAIVIEANILLTKSPNKWDQLLNLEKATYKALKNAYPKLPVFVSIDTLHLLGQAGHADVGNQRAQVKELLKYSDIMALSVYPFMNPQAAKPCPDNFLDFATGYNKPLAIAESGYLSRPVRFKNVELPGSDSYQSHWFEYLLKEAQTKNYLFVVNFASIDYEKMVSKLPAGLQELAGIWTYTGLANSKLEAKPAMAVWDRFFKLPYHAPTARP